MEVKHINVPLADVLVETGIGIIEMNRALARNNVGATSATVKIRFMASFDYKSAIKTHNFDASGASFNFFFLGGNTTTIQSTDMEIYRKYSESIRIDITVNFETLPKLAA